MTETEFLIRGLITVAWLRGLYRLWKIFLLTR